MKLKDLSQSEATPYKKTCRACKKEYTVYTHYPEYHTEIFVQCECGDVVPFSLPVN